ncbi:MAG: molybdenum ABC transporter ATP-binding protein [Rhodobacterales bacterium]|nr:MAG: molybdenum ABC transporter ATP-binding protein [Rhodobacterales bacterium]
MTDCLYLDISLQLGDHRLSAQLDLPLQGITALEGASGSGKTSLLRCIAGLERRCLGRISFGAQIWQDQRRFLAPQKRRIGYVFQDTRLFAHLTVRDNLAYGHQRAGAAGQVLQRVVEALDLGDLLQRRVEALSGGEAKRVALGRALAMDPQLLLLDEPLTGLDRRRKDEILPYIADAVQATGCPAIYVSHERRETALLADRVLRMQQGRLSGPEPCDTHLNATARHTNGQWRLCVDGHPTGLTVPDGAKTSYTLRLNPESVVLSQRDPGPCSAMLCLPVELRALGPVEAGHRRLTLGGAGGQLRLLKPAEFCQRMQLSVGQKLWLMANEASIAGPQM